METPTIYEVEFRLDGRMSDYDRLAGQIVGRPDVTEPDPVARSTVQLS